MWPSAGACATISVPMTEPPPGRLSTMKVCPRSLPRLSAKVRAITDALPPAAYEAWLRRADVAVQLRRTTNGESSGTVADALANGVPTVVTRIGWFAEIPDSAVEGVSVAAAPVEVASAVVRVLSDPIRRAEMIRSGYGHAARNGFDRAAAVLEARYEPGI